MRTSRTRRHASTRSPARRSCRPCRPTSAPNCTISSCAASCGTPSSGPPPTSCSSTPSSRAPCEGGTKLAQDLSLPSPSLCFIPAPIIGRDCFPPGHPTAACFRFPFRSSKSSPHHLAMPNRRPPRVVFSTGAFPQIAYARSIEPRAGRTPREHTTNHMATMPHVRKACVVFGGGGAISLRPFWTVFRSASFYTLVSARHP